MGRPRKDNPLIVVAVRVEPRVAARLTALAERTDRSHSELLRLIVGLGLERLEPDPESDDILDGGPGAMAELVWETIQNHLDARTGLVSVPRVVRELVDAGVATVEAAIDSLNLLDQQGRIELRVESGVGLLRPADAALCPRGMKNASLSWLRVR